MEKKVVVLAGKEYLATICPAGVAKGAFSEVSARPARQAPRISEKDRNGVFHRVLPRGLNPGQGLPF